MYSVPALTRTRSCASIHPIRAARSGACQRQRPVLFLVEEGVELVVVVAAR